jgi:hypothetical protein
MGRGEDKAIVAWQQSTECYMSQPNNLRRYHTTLDQDSSLIAVVEMSQSSWLVAGIVPGIFHGLTEAETNRCAVSLDFLTSTNA